MSWIHFPAPWLHLQGCSAHVKGRWLPSLTTTSHQLSILAKRGPLLPDVHIPVPGQNFTGCTGVTCQVWSGNHSVSLEVAAPPKSTWPERVEKGLKGVVLPQDEERDAERANMAGICHRDGNNWPFTFMTTLKSSYDFLHSTENWIPECRGLAPRPHCESVVNSRWEPPSLCSCWDFLGPSKPGSGSGPSMWSGGGRRKRPRTQPQPEEASRPIRALCGSCSHLCQVAPVLRWAGAC